MPNVLLAAAALLLSAAPATAQEQPAPAAPPAQDIVVTGKRQTPADAEAIKALTRTITRRSAGQLARFAAPVCAVSAGFAAEHDRVIVDRIHAAARDAGVPVAQPGCGPANVTVVFVDSGQQVLQALYKVRPALFAPVGTSERKRLLADPGPVHVVTFTELRSRDGNRVGGQPNGAASGFDALPTLLVQSASNLSPSTRQDIGGVVVLIDREAALGKSLRQLGDYAAMRALARTRDAQAGDDSILTLFGADQPPRELTAFDRAYLRALYTGSATQTAASQLGSIRRSIRAGGASAATDDPQR